MNLALRRMRVESQKINLWDHMEEVDPHLKINEILSNISFRNLTKYLFPKQLIQIINVILRPVSLNERVQYRSDAFGFT